MSDRQAWPGQPYLDELRPGRLETVRLALFATYSVDLSAVAATLLALIGRNNEKGSGTAVDFAQAIDTLRDRVRIIIQRGRIARPVALPRIAGILDQFIAEQDHDERDRSWHPKIALVAYDCPRGEIRWKLWIGSRNLTRSQDLDVGVLLDGTDKRAKGRVRLERRWCDGGNSRSGCIAYRCRSLSRAAGGDLVAGPRRLPGCAPCSTGSMKILRFPHSHPPARSME